MLLDLISTQNAKGEIAIKKITNVRTIHDISKKQAMERKNSSHLKDFLHFASDNINSRKKFSALRCLKHF